MIRDFTHRDEVRSVYRKRAALYDFTANLYYLLGFRLWDHRQQAVRALHLRPGDTVVEIGCGTGLNFGLMRDAIGPTGRIIGVDLTDAMLEQAAGRVRKQNWDNVTLVQSSAAAFEFPSNLNGVISTFALTLEPGYATVIKRAEQALRPGGRLVVADIRLPPGWLRYLAPLMIWLVRPFAVSMAVAKRRPWDVMRETLAEYRYLPRYFGIGYIASGRAISDASQVSENIRGTPAPTN
ncbi:MAG: class I SAM-dependent methyltransferase [Proteobacteria bacterium]|nr:class I SAM-dependent methyltransferase [Pseudomonadota bacterium]